MTLKNIIDVKAALQAVVYPGYTFFVTEGPRAWLQATFQALDCKTGAPRTQYTRKWYLSHDATKSEVVQTMLKCVLTSVEHEVRETFLYRGRPIFGPHMGVDTLWAEFKEDPRPESVSAKTTMGGVPFGALTADSDGRPAVSVAPENCDNEEWHPPGGYLIPKEHARADAEMALYRTRWEQQMQAYWSTQGVAQGGQFRGKNTELAHQPAKAAKPIDMVLHCPACHKQHIDAPAKCGACEGEAYVDGNQCRVCKATGLYGWANPPHRSHLCAYCEHIWRPADVPTNGVAAVKTKGRNDSPLTGA